MVIGIYDSEERLSAMLVMEAAIFCNKSDSPATKCDVPSCLYLILLIQPSLAVLVLLADTDKD